MPRKTSPSFVHHFELEHFGKGQGSLRDLELCSNFYRRLYNAVLGALYQVAKELKASLEWEEVRKLPRQTKEQQALRGERFEALKKSRRLTKNDAEKLAKNLVGGSQDFLYWTNSAIVQKVAERAINAVERFVRGKAKRLRFKKASAGFNFEGKSNSTGVRILEQEKQFVCLVGRRRYKIHYSVYDDYDVHALSSRCKYARVIFKVIDGKKRVFVQGVFEGLPFEDKDKKERHRQSVLAREGADYLERKESLLEDFRETVAYDIGPKHIAVATALTSFERPLCEGVDRKQREIRRLQRALDRSRRKSNPQNYNEDGTIKKGRKSWSFSKNYKKKRAQYADLERRKGAERKSSHGNLANEILSYGSWIHTEHISVKGWQKRWGRSIGHHAPSALTSELTRKAAYARGRLEKINTQETALSQHCICGSRKKKKLSERIHNCVTCGFKAKRDSLSAYLAIFCKLKQSGRGKGWQIDFANAGHCLAGHRTLSLNGPDATTRPYEMSQQKSVIHLDSRPIVVVG